MLKIVPTDAMSMAGGRTGMFNVGNTCYANSAVQAVAQCMPMSAAMMDCPPQTQVCK